MSSRQYGGRGGQISRHYGRKVERSLVRMIIKNQSYKYVGLLDILKNTKVSYYIIEGEDHNLSNNTISLESLVEKYLFD